MLRSRVEFLGIKVRIGKGLGWRGTQTFKEDFYEVRLFGERLLNDSKHTYVFLCVCVWLQQGEVYGSRSLGLCSSEPGLS